jgi:hypothetical protein
MYGKRRSSVHIRKQDDECEEEDQDMAIREEFCSVSETFVRGWSL